MPTYSFGESSPMKFELSTKMALDYNSAVEKFFKAQARFKQKLGRQWDPHKDPIALRWTRRETKAWNDFAKIFRKVNEATGPFFINEIYDDFLVENVSKGTKKPSKLISSAVLIGVLYGAYRGSKRAV